MHLQTGEMLLHYRMVEKIGQGGMGVVWKAVDTTLDRAVAIKILPDEFAADATRLARFEREARLLASLNHANIATVHSTHEVEGVRFLAMEFVDGEDLAQRLARGAIPVEEALHIAAQMTEALEAAHGAGVVHRDLKPANIRLTPAGKIKILDFGLAKSTAPVPVSGSPDASPSMSPTVTSAGTGAGVIMGTAAYMSPEQARGKPVDRRADIWSFGVVLFEALTGRPLFQCPTVTESIGAILHKEPGWSALPPQTPPLVMLLLRRCLQKDSNRRLRDIGDALIDLQSALADPAGGDLVTAHKAPRLSRLSGVLVAGALSVAVLLGVMIGRWSREQRLDIPAPTMVRFSLDLTAQNLTLNSDSSNLALDRSGSLLAFAAQQGNRRYIFVRPLADSGEVRALPGTEGGTRPFFSPDGRWLGFIRNDKLMKVPSAGGPALTICDADEFFADPSWLDDGTIVFIADNGATLLRVDAAGGEPATLTVSNLQGTEPEREVSIWGFDSPVAVPGLQYVLASIFNGVTIEDYDVVAVSLMDGAVRKIMSNGTQPQYLPPDRLIFSRESALYAAPFDAQRGVVTGEAELVVDGVWVKTWADDAQYAVATNGTLAYVPGRRQGPGRRLVRVDSSGRSQALLANPDAFFGGIRVSPDGKKLVLTTLRRKAELWSFDLRNRSFSLISDIAPSYSPVWMPDSSEVVYQREGIGTTASTIVRQSVDGSDDGIPVGLLGSAGFDRPTSVSPDGRFLLMARLDPSTQKRNDVVLFRLGEEGPAEPLVATPAGESDAVFSPDGNFYAYVSDESGRNEIYVRQFPDTGRRWQVSAEGGYEPKWSRKGDKLFFLRHGALFMSPVNTQEGFLAGRPEKMFDLESVDAEHIYDVLPDDSFVMVEPAAWENEDPRIEIAVHWDRKLQAE